MPQAALMGPRVAGRQRADCRECIQLDIWVSSILFGREKKNNSQLFSPAYPHPLGWTEGNSLLYDESKSNSNKEIIFLNPIVWMAHYTSR